MAHAEWIQLPRDLINEIAQRLGSPSQILRFRSVCSTWRHSVTDKSLRLPNLFRVLNDGISDASTCGFYLSKRTIYRLDSADSDAAPPLFGEPKGWIIKTEEDVPNRMHLQNPLSSFKFHPLPVSFPKTFDSLEFRCCELLREYVLRYVNRQPWANSAGDEGTLYMEKVAFWFDDSGSGLVFALLTIHVSGKLAILRSGEKKWTVIPVLAPPHDDVILYKGQFYAVDHTGRTVIVELSMNLVLVANSVFGGDKKYLVESNGELLLVDMFLSVDGPGDPVNFNGEWFNHQFEGYINERIVRFKVYKLNAAEKQWIEVFHLGDRLLFLGENSTFSLSASDLGECKGNCIYFMDNSRCSNRIEDGPFMTCGIGVYDMEYDRLVPVTCYPGCSKLFWPPPRWITPTITDVEKNFGDLSI